MAPKHNPLLSKIILHLVIAAAFAGGTAHWVFGQVYPAFDARLEEVAKKAADYVKVRDGKFDSYGEVADVAGELPPYVSNRQSDALAAVKEVSSRGGDFLKELAAANKALDEKSSSVAYEKDVLGSIVPTFSSAFANDSLENGISNRVDLRRLVQYMEDQVMRKYNFDTPFPVGIDGLTFEKVEGEQYKAGSFTLNLPLSGDPRNIASFLSVLDSAGKIPMTSDGKIDVSKISARKAAPAFSPMDNMLMTVEQVNLDGYMQPSADGKASGNVTVRFYVRTLDYDETRLLENAVAEKISGKKGEDGSGLKAEIEKAAKSAADAEKKLCDGAARQTASCPLNNPLYVRAATALKGSPAALDQVSRAFESAKGKKGSGTETAYSAALSDVYRRLQSVERYFKDARDMSDKYLRR